MPLQTLDEIAIEKSKKQPKQIELLTNEAPILKMIPFEASTHDMWHAAEQVDSIDAMGFVDIDAPLPDVGTTSKLIKFDLAKMGGKITVGEDKARLYGGKEKYFAERTPHILKRTGMSTEQVIVYDNLRQFIIDQYNAGNTTKNVYDAAGSANANYSIVAVRFEEGVCSGLYNSMGFGNGVMFDTQPINGGSLYAINTAGTLGYGVRLKSDLGFQLVGVRNVGAVVNIDLANSKNPTSTMIDDMLADIRATGSGRTMLFMHKRVLNYLSETYKTQRVRYREADQNVYRKIEAWDDVPIVTSYNMYDATEANVSLS